MTQATTLSTYPTSLKPSQRLAQKLCIRRLAIALPCFAMLTAISYGMLGCNGLPSATTTSKGSTPAVPQKYMAPPVAGPPGGGDTSVLQAYTFDDTAHTFDQVTYPVSLGGGQQIDISGVTTPLARGLLALGTTYVAPVSTNPPTIYNPPQAGSWAVELPDQAGGLVQLLGQAFTPLVAASACPSSTAQDYQFLTIPTPLLVPPAGTAPTRLATWNPAVETAYGNVAIAASGSNVTLSNIQQSTFPGIAGTTGTPGSASPTSVTGVCSSTPFGDTIEVPGQLVITDPGSDESVPATATIGIGPTGLLVESNGGSNNTAYENILGAGTGAIGLPKPLSALATSSFVGAQYLGFIYGSGLAQQSQFSSTGWTSTVASFGFSAAPAACAGVTAPTSTLIYGGDFPNNDPSAAAVQSAGGFGNCDYAIDLGAQDSSNNGYYPAATVWVGANFSGNTKGTSYSFPAVAIAGQLGGKNAIFVLGVDTTGSPNQAQGIYLLQSE